jgi:nitrite reductase/ring-hydroxylating ferredoxin subunit
MVKPSPGTVHGSTCAMGKVTHGPAREDLKIFPVKVIDGKIAVVLLKG